MTWALVSKKEVQCRKDYQCADCETHMPVGAYVKNYTYKKDTEYKVKKICEECEKYYRRADPKMES